VRQLGEDRAKLFRAFAGGFLIFDPLGVQPAELGALRL
jgi:hypothetical protein